MRRPGASKGLTGGEIVPSTNGNAWAASVLNAPRTMHVYSLVRTTRSAFTAERRAPGTDTVCSAMSRVDRQRVVAQSKLLSDARGRSVSDLVGDPGCVRE
jgi:hypothetical protein